MSLPKLLKKKIQENELISQGERILVGVSGGADSVALLHLLQDIKYDWGISLHIAHYNHKWRDSANEDEQFVASLAKELTIPISLGHARETSQKDANKSEEKARKARFAFFKRVQKKTKSDKLFLAHTEDDLAETILMRIIRGTGLKGLQGIQLQSINEELRIIRPLLDVRKKELMAYLKANRIKYREDPTNKDPQYLRNKIRLELLPHLQDQYNPQITSVLVSMARTAVDDFSIIDQMAKHAFATYCQWNPAKKRVILQCEELKNQPAALQRSVLRHIYQQLVGNQKTIGFRHVTAVEQAISSSQRSISITWPHRIRIKRGKGDTICFIQNRS